MHSGHIIHHVERGTLLKASSHCPSGAGDGRVWSQFSDCSDF